MEESEKMNHCYLGDSVYAEFDGYGIWLRTEHHTDEKCSNRIFIEPFVLNNLYSFASRFKKPETQKDA